MAKNSEILQRLHLNKTAITKDILYENNFDFNHFSNFVIFKNGKVYSFNSKYHLQINKENLTIIKN